MSLTDAHAFAFSLAVMPANEYDGDTTAIVHEIDPFAF